MFKKRFSAFAILLTCLALVICISESTSVAGDQSLKNTSPASDQQGLVSKGPDIVNNGPQALQPFIDSGRLPQAVRKKLEATGRTGILLRLEDADVKGLASRLRQARNLKHDDTGVISEKARVYKQKKDSVLSRISPENFKLLKDYDKFPIVYVEVDEKALTALLNTAEVRYIGENKTVLPYLAESLPLINTPEAHLAGATGAGTSVAVLDTGVDYTLGAFGTCTAPGAPVGTCRVAYAHDFAPDDSSLDDDGHGTNVSGIVAGVAPDTQVLGLDIFRTDGFAYYSDILSALNWVMDSKATYNIVAVNMSFGGGEHTVPCPSDTIAAAISEMKTAGITTVAAAGNDGYTNALGSPACGPDAVSVGAVYDSDLGPLGWCLDQSCGSTCTDSTTAADKVTCFSNSASFLTLLAPGSSINSAGISMSGTSQAAPHVSGAVALMKDQNSGLTVDQVVSGLTSTGVSVLDSRNSITKPRVDLYGVVSITSPIIGFTPSSLSFMAAAGGVFPAGKTLSITNNGAGTLNWDAGSTETWLTPAPLSGTAPGNVTLSVVTTGLAVGAYDADVTITAAGALNTPQAVPVTLEVREAAYSEDFESPVLTNKFPWVTAGNGSWTVQNTAFHTGAYAAQSPDIGDSASSYLQVTLNVTSPGYVYFWLKTSTEPDYDKVRFYVDTVNEGFWNGWSGDTDWTFVRSEHEVSAGVHTFKWLYSKDPDTSQGSDAVWLDDIFFPPVSNQIPVPSVGPSSKDFGSVISGGTSSAQTFTVSNTGTADLIIATVSFTGTHATQFTMENDACSGQTVLPSGNCTVDVSFAPSTAGAKTATLNIPSNYVSPTTASLSGTGLAAYALTVNKTGSTGTGTVTSDPAGISCGADCSEIYAQGTPVTLTAAADASSTFAGWSGGGCAGTGTCQVTMSANRSVTAVFNAMPPVADFAGLPVTGEALLPVDFTDASTNIPTSWSWNFGDGGSSTLQNPTHVYENPGVYTVSLTATNAGGPSTITKTNYITVTSLPLRISGPPPSYYSLLTAAYAAAAGGDAIQGQAAVFTGTLDCNRNISVTLKGGYDSLFTTNAAFTTINGSLAITAGTVTVENIIIK